jgi:tryptophan synthase alpha chain
VYPTTTDTDSDARSNVVSIEARRDGAGRIAEAFSVARAQRRAALMPFLLGGFPSLGASLRIGEACADAGADLVELGIPCADAGADGPVIRAAGEAALRAGATVDAVLAVARELAPRICVVVMCYARTVREHGLQRFADDLRDAGVCGLIVPDLSGNQAAALSACDARGLALVPLITPATGDGDVAAIAAHARGFIYAVAHAGPTGERAALPERPDALIARVQAHSPVPVALGFGISTPQHAAEAGAAGAEGVIVGSRFVRAAAEAADPAAAVRDLVADFSTALWHAPWTAAAVASRRAA